MYERNEIVFAEAGLSKLKTMQGVNFGPLESLKPVIISFRYEDLGPREYYPRIWSFIEDNGLNVVND